MKRLVCGDVPEVPAVPARTEHGGGRGEIPPQEVGRQRGQILAAATRIEHVGRHHDIVQRPGEHEARAAAGDQGALQVVPHLRNPGVGEDGADGREGGAVERGEVGGQVFARVAEFERHRRLVGDGKVMAAMRIGGNRDSGHLVSRGLQGAVQHGHRHGARLPALRRDFEQPGRVGDEQECGGGRFGLRPAVALRCAFAVEALHEGAELEVDVERAQSLVVRRRDAQVVEVGVELEICPDRHQLLREQDIVAVREQRLPGPFGLDLGGARQHFVDGPVLPEELLRGLRPDAGGARHVVRAVPDQREIVHHLPGFDSELLRRAFRVQPLRGHPVRAPAPRVEQVDPVSHQLGKVLVARDDHRLQPLRHRERGERSDHVVRFPPLDLDHPIAEGLDELANAGKAVAQLPRHLFAGCLVVGVELLPVAVARIEDHRDVVRLVLVADALEEVGEPEGRGGVLPPRVREGAVYEGEERPVDQRVGVDQEQSGRGLVRDFHDACCAALEGVTAAGAPGDATAMSSAAYIM